MRKKLESINEEDLKNITFDSFNANQHTLFIRKSTGTEDISGDYNDYSEINRIYINNLDVTTKGNNGKNQRSNLDKQWIYIFYNNK